MGELAVAGQTEHLAAVRTVPEDADDVGGPDGGIEVCRERPPVERLTAPVDEVRGGDAGERGERRADVDEARVVVDEAEPADPRAGQDERGPGLDDVE